MSLWPVYSARCQVPCPYSRKVRGYNDQVYIAKSGHQIVMISIQTTPVVGFLALMFCLEATADIEAVTRDGQHVILKDNKTWEYVQSNQADPSKSALMTVINVEDLGGVCIIGVRLQNNLGYSIKSLVPEFSAYKTGGIHFESLFKSFSSIKPSRSLYRKIKFNGIGCSEIDHILVHGADQCDMGKLDKFNNEKGECLSKIFVEPSDLINIRK